MAQTNSLLSTSIQDLAAFFRNNADVFLHHPELLELINLRDDRSTTSLLERQITALKQRLKHFQSQQFELIEVAKVNQQISDSFAQITCQLIGFTNLSEFEGTFAESLRHTFQIDEATFKTRQAVQDSADACAAYEDAVRRLADCKSICDNRWPSNILSLFFPQSIKSAALVPMLDSENGIMLGILALGSNDAEHYTDKLGTAHLDRLGVMTGICLARLQATT